MNKNFLWYVRRDGALRGPFPSRLVTQYILLGRITERDELSADGQLWQRLPELPELIPEVMKADLGDANARERLVAARRWADERGSGDRRSRCAVKDEGAQRRRRERRRKEAPEILEQRETRGQRGAEVGLRARHHNLIGYAVAVSLAGVFFGFIWFSSPTRLASEEGPNCNKPPRPGVDWSSCNFEGVSLRDVDLSGAALRNARFINADLQGSRLVQADLAYAFMNFSLLQGTVMRGARLFGTSLRNADLSFADLEGADLSYADLTGSQLHGVNMTGAKLDHAKWVDGTLCGAGSVGQCLVSNEP